MLVKRLFSYACGALLLAAALSGCAAGKRISSQQEQLDSLRREIQFLKDENARYKRELEDLNKRIEKVEGLSRGEKADLATRIDELQQQLDTIRSQFEETNYRITALTQATPGPGKPAPLAARPSGPDSSGASGQTALSDDSRELYNTAYRDLIRGNYQLALHGFQQFLQQYPESELSDNAQYWIGEVYYAQGRYSDAIQEFEKVLKWYKKGDKTPSALLKIGYAYIQIGESEQGKLYLEEVVRDYPDSDAANLAKGRLATMQ